MTIEEVVSASCKHVEKLVVELLKCATGQTLKIGLSCFEEDTV